MAAEVRDFDEEESDFYGRQVIFASTEHKEDETPFEFYALFESGDAQMRLFVILRTGAPQPRWFPECRPRMYDGVVVHEKLTQKFAKDTAKMMFRTMFPSDEVRLTAEIIDISPK